MEGLVSHQSSPHQFSFPVDPPTFQQRSSAHPYPQKLAYPSHSDPSLYDQAFLPQQQQQHFSTTPHALQIHTATPAPHEHDPEEQTAHPSRSESYPQLSRTPERPFNDSPQLSLQDHQQSIADVLSDPYGALSRPFTLHERELLAHLDRLKFFLATAPSRWNSDQGYSGTDPSTLPPGHPHGVHPAINRFPLPNSEHVSCVLWGGLYHITGTDIVRTLVFRFEAFGRPVRNMKKFEEGVFSDLRNLKPGVDACLEDPKSPFLDLLFKYQCIRTQKKQKVFFWFSVPHDRLFLDALERDLKREKMGLEPTTVVTGEPALSFTYDSRRSLYEQFAKAQGHREGEGELEAAVRRADEAAGSDSDRAPSGSEAELSASETDEEDTKRKKRKQSALSKHSPFFSMFSLFDGSPTYKQRRKKLPKTRKSSPAPVDPSSSSAAAGLSVQSDDYSLPGYGYQERQFDRFGRETGRLSAEDMFNTQARSDFGSSNPDIVASQKDRQRRAMEASVVKQPYLPSGGLSGPGVASDPSASGQGVLYNMSGQVVNALAYANASHGHHQHHQHQPHQQHAQYGQHMGGHRSQHSHLAQRHSFPMPGFPPHLPVRSDTDPYAAMGVPPSLGPGWPPGADNSAGANANTMLGMSSLAPLSSPSPRTKAFICPLFSCNRMFKRSEHLKRHLRTHTRERPFSCGRCGKLFSRSDNLTQHVRTHVKREGLGVGTSEALAAGGDGLGCGASGLAAAVPEGAGADPNADPNAVHGQMDMNIDMNMNVDMDPDGLEPEPEEADEEEEDSDTLELEGDEIDSRKLQYLPGGKGITSVRMCEVEVQGQVLEVEGDEEGLVTATGPIRVPALVSSAAVGAGLGIGAGLSGGVGENPGVAQYYDNSGAAHFDASRQAMNALTPPPASASAHASADNSPDTQWASVPSQQQQPSPPGTSSMSAYTTGALASLALQQQQSFHSHSQAQAQAGTTMGDYVTVTSLSAPSHKLSFDHAALYPSPSDLSLGGVGGGGPGPVRRHRSATPSIVRYGESIRRPYSAALSESGQSSSSASASGRAYHPYAVPGGHHHHSAQSSPMAFSTPLAYDGGHGHGGHSRSSSAGQQQLQMLSLEQQQQQQQQVATAAGDTAADAAAMTYGSQGLYRTESPMQYSSTAPAQQQQAGEAYEMETTGGGGGGGGEVQDVYAAVGLGESSGYFPNATHSQTL